MGERYARAVLPFGHPCRERHRESALTWDELRADAKILAARGDNQYGYYIPQWDSALPMIMTWDFGGDAVNADGKVNFDTDAFHKAADLYPGFYADGSVPDQWRLRSDPRFRLRHRADAYLGAVPGRRDQHRSA